MLTEKEVAEVMRMEGEVRTTTLQTDASSIIRLKGHDGLIRVEEYLRSIGHPIDYQKTRALGWCPLGLRVLSLLAIKDTFGWGENEIRAIGYAAPAYSFITKFFIKAMASTEIALSRASAYWSSHFSEGEMEVKRYKDSNLVSFIIRDFRGHPVLCKHIEGYLERTGQFLMHNRVRLQEVKCLHRGDDYHQYDLSW